MRILPRRKRWYLVAALVPLAIAAAFWIDSRPTKLKRQFDGIQVGMTREQAVAVLGTPDLQENYSDEPATKPNEPDRAAAWERGREYVVLVFDIEGRVLVKRYHRMSMTEVIRELWVKTFNRAAPF